MLEGSPLALEVITTGKQKIGFSRPRRNGQLVLTDRRETARIGPSRAQMHPFRKATSYIPSRSLELRSLWTNFVRASTRISAGVQWLPQQAHTTLIMFRTAW